MSRPLTPNGRAPPSYTARSTYGSDERPTDGSQNGAAMRLLTSVDENTRAALVLSDISIPPSFELRLKWHCKNSWQINKDA